MQTKTLGTEPLSNAFDAFLTDAVEHAPAAVIDIDEDMLRCTRVVDLRDFPEQFAAVLASMPTEGLPAHLLP